MNLYSMFASMTENERIQLTRMLQPPISCFKNPGAIEVIAQMAARPNIAICEAVGHELNRKSLFSTIGVPR